MIKQFNSTIAETIEAPVKTKEYKESTNKQEFDWAAVKEQIKSNFSKELVFMLSVSTAWFAAFVYCVLYVFT
jgi:hypothetical protein